MATAKKTTSSAPSSRAAKNVKKQIRKLSTGISVALIAVLIFSMAAGAGIAYLLTRNDVFSLDTNASLLFKEGDMVEESALRCKITAVSLSRDISGTLTVSTTLPAPEEGVIRMTEGTYYTTYTVRTQLGRTIRRIQTITVIAADAAEGGESLG